MALLLRSLVIYFTLIICTSVKSSPLIDDNDGTLVEIESGPIQGRILQSQNGKPFWAFQDIPYAAPPTGNRRYQLPQPPKPWKEVLNTTENRRMCYQGQSVHASEHDTNTETEDCLVINVYTPVKPGSSEQLPVMLWIHGGAYVVGSGQATKLGPKFLIDYDIVIVTFNYRLGVFGLLATEDGVIPPNLSFEDQNFAIKWVHRNIHLFGGDNKKVTLSGQSAGSMYTGRHLVGPWENDEELFQAVIMQSGSPLIAVSNARSNSTDIATELAQKIDPTFTPKNTTDLLKFLQSVDAKDIANYGIQEYSIDKQENGILQHFIDGNYKKVPVLLGFTSEESVSIFKNRVDNDELVKQIDNDLSLLISSNINMPDESKKIVGTLMKNLYTKNDTFYNNRGAFARYNTDGVFTTAICKQAQLASINSPYYLYQFSYKGDMSPNNNKHPYDGADSVGHSDDMYYLWDRTTNSDINKFPESDRLTMLRMLKMWTNFVKYHNPTPEDDSLLDHIRWPPTNPINLRYLHINETLEVHVNPKMYNKIRPILDAYIEPPYSFYNLL